MLRWLKRIILGLLATVALALAVIYGWSQVILNKTYEAEPRAIASLDDDETLARGERLASIYGCAEGCHGREMQGSVFFEDPLFGRAVAPNLTALVRDYTPEQFEAAVRQGIRADGTGLVGMPSPSFATLTDRDLGAIYSFISAYPEQETPDLPKTVLRPPARLFLVLGEFKMPPEEIEEGPWSEARLADSNARGTYLAVTACSECHGLEFRGQSGFAPPLTIAKAYDRDQFGRLITTGMAIDESRDLGLMAEVSKRRFSHFTEEEIDDLYGFLRDR